MSDENREIDKEFELILSDNFETSSNKKSIHKTIKEINECIKSLSNSLKNRLENNQKIKLLLLINGLLTIGSLAISSYLLGVRGAIENSGNKVSEQFSDAWCTTFDGESYSTGFSLKPSDCNGIIIEDDENGLCAPLLEKYCGIREALYNFDSQYPLWMNLTGFFGSLTSLCSSIYGLYKIYKANIAHPVNQLSSKDLLSAKNLQQLKTLMDEINPKITDASTKKVNELIDELLKIKRKKENHVAMLTFLATGLRTNSTTFIFFNNPDRSDKKNLAQIIYDYVCLENKCSEDKDKVMQII